METKMEQLVDAAESKERLPKRSTNKQSLSPVESINQATAPNELIQDAYDAIDEIIDTDTVQQLQTVLVRLAKVFDCEHFHVQNLEEFEAARYRYKILTSFPQCWMQDYVDQRYIYIDPLAQSIRHGSDEFYWEDLRNTNPNAKEFFDRAAEHGVSPIGYSRRVFSKEGSCFVVSLTSRKSAEEFKQTFSLLKDSFTNMSNCIVDVFTEHSSNHSYARHLLQNSDVLNALKAIEHGKPIESITPSFGSINRLKRLICAAFDTETVEQAAVLVARMGLTAENPLEYYEIVTSSGEKDV